ncbi:hypothetical protein ACT3UM_02300 [Halomonas sp. AOP13-D3-9]
MRFGFLNNFAAQLAAPVAEDAIEIELSTGAEAIATALGNADAVALTLFVVDAQGNETKREVVYATAVAESMVTVEREQEGTTAATFTAGDGVESRLTAAPLQQMLQGVAGTMPTGIAGAIALGGAYEHEGEAFGPAQAVAAGALALGSGSYATSDSAMAIGGKVYAALEWEGDPVLVSAAQANATGAMAIGPGAQATAGLGIAIGDGSRAYGVRSIALAGASANGARSCSIGANSSSHGDDSLAAAGGYASSDGAVALGADANSGGESSFAVFGSTYSDAAIVIGVGAGVNAPEGIALGADSSANGPASVVIGKGAQGNAEGVTVIGRNAAASSPKSSAYGDGAEAQPPGVTAIGSSAQGLSPETVAAGLEATAQAPYCVALGRGAVANIPGGLAVNAISYIPATYNQTGEFAGPPPNTSRQAAMQVVVATEPLDLTDSDAVATLTLPANAMLFPDAFDLVVIDADSVGGAPEIQIGPDDTDPADYLAATAISKTAIGERETFEPLISDGVTTLRVSVVAAGTGTLSAKVVVRGYVMEI